MLLSPIIDVYAIIMYYTVSMRTNICPNTGSYCSRYGVFNAITEAQATGMFRPADFGVDEDPDIIRNRQLEQVVNMSELQNLIIARDACAGRCALAGIGDVADYAVNGPPPHAQAC